jgi:hypothetical protein
MIEIDLVTGIIISACILFTYLGIKVINWLFDKTDKKKKNSLF